MRIINRKTFLELPAGTIFSKYTQGDIGTLCIKSDTWPNDFIYQSIADAVTTSRDRDYGDTLALLESGESVSMDFDSCGRDGCFDYSQLFAVWDHPDVLALIKRLSETIK